MEVKLYGKFKKIFSIYSCLPNVIKIYNENIHFTNNYKPKDLFDASDKNIIKKVIDNIKNSRRKFKKNIDGFKINTKCLFCENFKLKGKNIKYKKFRKKGNILFRVKL